MTNGNKRIKRNSVHSRRADSARQLEHERGCHSSGDGDEAGGGGDGAGASGGRGGRGHHDHPGRGQRVGGGGRGDRRVEEAGGRGGWGRLRRHPRRRGGALRRCAGSRGEECEQDEGDATGHLSSR
jgi:hypothetical protein